MFDTGVMYAVHLRYNHADQMLSCHRTLEGAIKRRNSLRETLKVLLGFDVYLVTVDLED